MVFPLKAVLLATAKDVAEFALQYVIYETFVGQPLADGTVPWDDFQTTSEDKQQEPLPTESRRNLEIKNQNQRVFFNPQEDSFDDLRRNIPVSPNIVIESDTRNFYTEKVSFGLINRQYGATLYKVKPNENFKYKTRFKELDFIKEIWDFILDKSQENLESFTNNSGQLINSLDKNIFLKLKIPNTDVTHNLVGDIPLILLYRMLRERLKEIDNFPLVPEVIPQFFEIEELPNDDLLDIENSEEVKNVNNRFIFNHESLQRIYDILGGRFFYKKLYQDDNRLIELEKGEISKDYFPAEDLLKSIILTQFKDEKAVKARPNGFDEEKVFQKVKNLPDVLLALLSVFQYRLGLDEFPLEMPESFTNDEDLPEDFESEERRLEEIENTIIPYEIPTKEEYDLRISRYLQDKQTGNIDFDVISLTELQARQVFQLDELCGQYPLKIKVEESDLIKTDGETLELVYPNQAEAIKEILRFTIEQKAIAETDLKIDTNTLIESGNTRIMVYKLYHMVDSIMDFLGYQTKQKKKKLPMTYDQIACQKNLEDEETDDTPYSCLLQEKELELTIEEYDDDTDFQRDWSRILEAAAIIKAQFFVRTGRNIADNFLVDKLKGYKESLENKEDDFEDKLEEIEEGYKNTGNVDDPEKPYGLEREKRPQIRVITKQEDETNGTENFTK